jgi:mRNA-degrading endonuclease toxin of MazEF toxin-antitoxin module
MPSEPSSPRPGVILDIDAAGQQSSLTAVINIDQEAKVVLLWINARRSGVRLVMP